MLSLNPEPGVHPVLALAVATLTLVMMPGLLANIRSVMPAEDGSGSSTVRLLLRGLDARVASIVLTKRL